MIDIPEFRSLLSFLGFTSDESSVGDVMRKSISENNFELAVDFTNEEIIYPLNQGFKVHQKQTCNFSATENMVVLECVHRLLSKGYHPQHIELEPEWKLGHGGKSGRADILVRNQQGYPLLIIECKTSGREFEKAWKDTLADGAQLISYVEQEKATQFICLYASAFDVKNKNIQLSQRIISVKDNPKILQDQPKALAFQKATNARERFKVWKETYQQEYTETGIFEENIQAYQIGKNKYTLLDDTQPLAAMDIKGAYHRFRTILRKHNVSRRENAFEVLVNLFVCKIVDEFENPNDLHFYWKGIAYDNYFDLVDRLQFLYKTGMQRFLGQDIVYVSNSDIENAFWPIPTEKRPNAIERQIKKLFRELKFFKGLDFEFIKVFNQSYFDKNAKILIEIIQMWQGLRLTGSSQNQFLGDMFEYFLDNGIKQSEGQFFTPVPICKFIVSCLPLEQLITASHEPIKVIDYACGSGHFLTEYATQLPPLLQHIKQQTDSRPWYGQIYGIEKEDRLAKVAKVSAFMYGFNEIRILDADALVQHADIVETGHDILIANPPFAVEDFLQTVPEEERTRYNLLSTVNDLGNKNVQCFFLERAKQLLKVGGVLGVIVPSSILSNTDSMHIATREILLKNFDFIAITELGSNTFGKTGTNTVALFLRRKIQLPEPQEHFYNRINNLFNNWDKELETNGGEYADVGIVRSYCSHLGVDFDAYQSLIQGTPDATLCDTELFQDYRRAFNESNIIKKLKTSKDFNKQSEDSQQLELSKRFSGFCQEIEKNKLLYYWLAHHNSTPVLLIKSPSENKAQQQFLGYEWSGAKGQEGIRYFGGDSIHNISTPLFDPQNRNNPSKISALVRQNFEGTPFNIPTELTSYVTQARMVDLLEFGRVGFDCVLSLTPNTKAQNIISKWTLTKLSEVSEIQSGGTPDSNNPEYWDGDIYWATLVDTKTKYLYSTKRKISNLGLNNSSAKILPIGTVIFSSRATIGEITIAKIPVATNQGYKNFICNLSKIYPEYLYEILYYYKNSISQLASGMTFKEISKTEISNFKIPLPPLNIQQCVVDECETVDKQVEAAKLEIEKSSNSLAHLLKNEMGKNTDKLKNIAVRVANSVDPQQQNGIVNYIGLENIEAHTGCLVGTIESEYSSIKSTKTCFQRGDLLYGKLRPNLNKVYLAQEDGICSTDIYVLRLASPALSKIYAHYLRSIQFNEAVLLTVRGQQLPRTSWKTMGEITIPLLLTNQQMMLFIEIEKLENTIANARSIIESAPLQKQEILKKYL